MHSDCCVICLSNFVVEYSSSGRSSNATVEKEAHVIFILRNLFEVPRDKLQSYLLGNGNPSSWGISLCSRCTEHVKELKGIYGQMMKFKRKFNATKARILGIAKTPDESIAGERGGVIVRETRAFMHDRKYLNTSPSTDPSKQGDFLARNLLFEKGYISHPIQMHSGNLQKLTNGHINPSTQTGRHYYNELYEKSHGNFQVPNELTNRFSCSQCGKDFSARNKLRFHAMNSHLDTLLENEKLPGISDKRFQGICNFFFRNGLAVDGTTKQNALQSCAKCGLNFSDRRYLQNHWMKVHYAVLAERLKSHQAQILKNLPPVPSLNSLDQRSNVEETPSPSCSTSGPGTSEMFKCTHCTQIFFNPEKLKEHAVLHHPEQFFPPSQFNLSGVLLETFQASCQLLFRGEDIKKTGDACFSCPLCLKGFLSRDTVLVHLVETHYDHMVLKLLKIVKQSARTPRASTVAAVEADTQRLLDSILEPQNHNSTAVAPPPVSSTSTNYPIPMPDRRLFPARGKRSDMKHPLRLKCEACGIMFSTAPCLSRHKNYSCHVRRLHGLLKDRPIVPRSYVRRGNPPVGMGRRGGGSRSFMGIPNHSQYYTPANHHPPQNQPFSAMQQFPSGFDNFQSVSSNNGYGWQDSSVSTYNEQVVCTPQLELLEEPMKIDVKCKMDSDEIVFLDEGDGRIGEEQFIGNDGLIVPDEDPLAM